jgi:D-sedoheptulose 7-phosphate isomerase
MEKVVFTNGCFDLLHPGHVDLLTRARALGTKLIVGINSDASIRAIKGPGRPIQDQNARREILLSLKPVDEVIIFDELTPAGLIKNLKPNVLVKGGDWLPDEIVGADEVIASGGEVHSLPLKDGYSSTKLVEKFSDQLKPQLDPADRRQIDSLTEHVRVFGTLIDENSYQIDEAANVLIVCLKAGGKILVCGNGGSAADAQHLAAEFVGRYENERRALPAIALTTDTSALTALANDYDFERVFARQVEALARPGDCLIAISTSGNSRNVIAAVMTARSIGCMVIGLTGANGKKLAALCDAAIMVPSSRTSRIQEAHIAIAHVWCEMVDNWLSEKTTT